MSVFCGKEGFVVDGFLYVSHDVVNVLRRGELALLSLFIDPHVHTLAGTGLRLRSGLEMETNKW